MTNALRQLDISTNTNARTKRGRVRMTATGRARGSGSRSRRALILDAVGRRRETDIEIARLERVLVLAQRRIVGRRRHRKSRRQAVVEQARALQFLEARQIAQRFQTEVRQEVLG